MKLRKLLAILLVLAMIFGLFSISVYATATNTTTFNFTSDSNVTTATVSGSSSLKIIDSVGPEVNGNTKTCQIELSPKSTASSATITLKKNNETKATLTATLPTTTPTETSYTSVQTTINGTTYVFTFVMETSYTTGSNKGGVYISLPDDGVQLGSTDSTASPFVYPEATTTASGFPQYVSLRLVPGGSNYDTASDIAVTLNTSDSSSGVTLQHYAGTYYAIYFPANDTTAVFSVAYKLNGETQDTVTFSINMNYNPSTDPGSGIWSYLPAPGQFVNEGIGTGGWGDIHQSGSANLKAMRGAVTTTGVSLGAFGGTLVYDFGSTGITNSNSLKYGIDFIIYGNAFSTNAEPGCVQVAPDADNDGIPDKWYDIAGCKYYSGQTVTMYYSNPTPSDNTGGTSTSANVPYSTNVTISGNTQTWSNISYITTNTFHNHSWFPLARNYFDGIERNATTYTGSDASGDMANVSSLNPESGSNPITVMENQTVNGGSSTTVISYKGRLIPWSGGNAGNYTFGYADVHANGSNYGTASNPYSAVASTTGGDGIDISWAVNDDGTPVTLTKIRFVRIYTGIQQINNPFGEVSTEVCGIYKASGTTSQTALTPTIKVGNSTVSTTNGGIKVVDYLGTSEKTVTVTPNTGSTGTNYVYINGVATNSASFTPTSAGTIVQIIVQNGEAAPYITYLSLQP
jgi:hypothetical protein